MGKYARDTGKLSLVEHGAYNLLLDHYYSTGGLPNTFGDNPVNKAVSNAQLMPDHCRLYRVCKAISQIEQKAVDSVLGFFFALDKDGFYRHEKCEEILLEQKDKHATRVRVGRENRNKALLKQCSSNAGQTQTQIKTKNQDSESLNKNSEEKKGSAFKVENFLDDVAIKRVREVAPGWDIHWLMREYDERVNGGTFKRPDKPAGAFINWCKSFTKGKKPT